MSKERESVGVDRTPRTRDELTALLRERQAGWEYLLYAGSLLINQISLEDEYRDHLLRYVPLTADGRTTRRCCRDLANPDGVSRCRSSRCRNNASF